MRRTNKLEISEEEKKPLKRSATDERASPKKKSKTKKDPAYSLRKDPQYQRARTGRKASTKEKETSLSFMNPRADTHTTDENGKEIKTTAVFGFNNFQPKDKPLNEEEKKKITERFDTYNAKVPTYVPPVEVTYNANGSPFKVIFTPKKTEYPRTGKLGPASIFSTDPKLIPLDLHFVITGIPEDSDFYNSAEYASIRKISDDSKFQKLFITRDSLKAVKKEIDLTTGRPKSQNYVMTEDDVSEKEGSATAYTQATGEFSCEVVMEWSHLKAYYAVGKLGQVVENLIAATKNYNINSRFLESQYPYLAKEYPKGFECIYKADLIPTTHIGTSVQITLVTPHFTLEVPLNAQDPNPPHIANGLYFLSALRTAVDSCKENESQATVQSTSTETTIIDDKEVPTTPKKRPLQVTTQQSTEESSDTAAENKQPYQQILNTRKRLRFELFDNKDDNKENVSPNTSTASKEIPSEIKKVKSP